MATLALHLIMEGKNAKAAKVLAYADKVMPEYNVPVNFQSGGADYAAAYAMLGNKAKASQLLNKVVKNAEQYCLWYLSLDDNRFMQSQRDCMLQFYILGKAADVARSYDEKLAESIENKLKNYSNQYTARGGRMPEDM